jgi:tRNA(Ile)-lysidine synthase
MCLERREIEKYLNDRNIRYCTDSTNLGDDYTRNKIRHHILEKAVSDISPAAVSNIKKACDRIDEAYALISDLTDEAFNNCVIKVNDNKNYKRAYHIEELEFLKVHKTIQSYVIMETLSKTAGKSKDLESVHVNDVKGLFDSQCGKSICLPYGMTARRDYTGILIYIENTDNNQNIELTNSKFGEIVIEKSEMTRLEKGEKLKINLQNNDFLTLEIQYNYEKNLKLENIPQKKYTKWFDYDKIKGSIVIRARKQGDYLTINSVNQKKSLKSYFIDEKIPSSERDKMLLLACESHIMWILGARISNYYKVEEDTERILCVTYTFDDKGGM